MNRTTISVCHSLSIIPLSDLTRYVRIKSKVMMSVSGKAFDPKAIPGTIKVTATSDKGIIKKKISFDCSDVSLPTVEELELYRFRRLLAVYIDESGYHRVCGSPDHPLTLDCIIEGGVLSSSLEGEDSVQDGFLA